MANEFVTRKGLISLGGISFPYTFQNTTYTVTSEDYYVDCNGTFTVTLPTSVGITGRIYVVKNSGNGTITVSTTLSETIDGQTSKTLSQYESLQVQSTGNAWVAISSGSSVTAGLGLTSNSGVLDINLQTNSGLTFSGDNVTLETNSDSLEINNLNQLGLKSSIIGTRTFQDDITFNGSASFMFGALQQGNLTTVNGAYGLASGQNTIVDGFAAAAFGGSSEAQATYSFVAGEGTIAYSESQIALGKYNLATNSTDLLVIGNGTDASNRSDLANFATNSITFNSTFEAWSMDFASVSVPTQERRMRWDQNNRTVALGLAGGNVNLQLGQEEFYLVANQTGATLSNGKLVSAYGVSASGDCISAGYYIANGTIPGAFVLGVVTEDIIPNDKGFVTEFGLVRGIDTTGTEYGETWLDGDILYASPTTLGGLTKVRPASPNIAVLSAIVISATTSGSIFVRPTFSGSLNDLDDVEFYSATPSSEATLQYSSTASLWTWRERNYGAYAAGLISGATAWSQSGNGTITLPTVTVALYDNSNFTPPLRLYTLSGTISGTGTTPALVNEDTNYIFIEYNNGSPRWNLDQTGTTINGSDIVRYMTVYRAGNFIHNLEFGNYGSGLSEKINARIIQTERFARESGLTIGLSGSSGILTLSEGVAWNGPFRQELASVNSADDFLFKNYHVSGVWTYSVATPFTFATESDLINNEFYDNGTDRITASASKYLVNWYYRGQEINDHLYEVLGNAQYDNFGDAELSGQPAIPELVQSHAILVGRVIVQVGTYSGVAQTSFGSVFQSSSVTSHNDLSGIQGGATNDYYHLTLNQVNTLAFDNIDNNFSANQTINGYLLNTGTWNNNNILISTTNSVVGSGFTFSDSATSSQTVWSAEKVYNYSNRETIDGNKTFSGDVLIQGTLSVLDAFTAGSQFYVNRTILPSLDSTYDLGSSSLMWNSLYVASQSIYVGGVTISSDNDSISINRLNLGTEGNPVILSASGSEIYLNSSIFSSATDVKTVLVAKSGADFTSVKAAVESISGASSTNPFVIRVRPGLYNEDPFELKPWVAILGESSASTILKTTNSAVNFITAKDNTFLSDLYITGATGTSASSVYYGSTTSVASQAIVYVENVRFGANWNHVTVRPASGGNIAMQLTNIKYGAEAFTLGFYITSDGSSTGRMQLRNVTTTAGGIQSATGLVFAKTDQPNCTIIANSVGMTKTGAGVAQGIGFQAENGGLLRINGANFQRFSKAIYIPSGGSTPTIDAIGLNFENCTTDVEILNTSTLGKIDGISDYTKTIVPKEAPIYLVGRDQRRITVAKKGGDFISIGQAVNSITDSSETSRYVIEVGPGEYYENEIDLTSRPYVSIVGANIQTTQVYASASNHNLFNMGIFNEISFLSLNGVGSGYAAISASNSGDFSQAHKVSFYDCDIGINVFSSTGETLFYGEYIDFNGTFSNAVCVTSENNQIAFANVENFYCFPSATGSVAVCVYNEGAELDVTVATLEGVGNDTAFYLENGASLKVAATDVTGYETGIWVPNIGTGSNFNFNASVMDDTVLAPINVENSQTIGFYQGSIYNHNLITTNSTDVYWQFLDAFDGELNITRKLSLTFEDGTTTDVTTLVFETGPMGVIEGGVLSIFSGLTISVSSGYGYLEVPATEIYKRIDWATSQLLLTDNASNYIYINDSGVLVTSPAFPDIITTIYLGRVVTNNGQVLIIDNTRVDTKHADNKLNLFNRKALGAVYESGSIVTVGNTSSSIDVTGGSYWYGDANFTPTGGGTVSFDQFYRDGIGGWVISTTNSVTSQYDAGSGSIITMSASYFTKHTLYVVGEGVDEKYLLVIGQVQYQNLVDAESAGLATPPNYFEDGVTSIASIYVQEGYNGIYQIEDIRPILGFKSSGVNASSDHGNLIGLSDDDHLQYLLVNGARAMSGGLVMGSNSISGVTTVNGVTVESHASRHSQNGGDPLVVGSPVAIGTVNSEGTSNDYVRRDHVHAHGDQPGGTLHSVATSTQSGFMSSTDKVTFDAIPATYVNVTGDTMTGVLTMSSNKITQLATGSNALDATNLSQVRELGAYDNFIYVAKKADLPTPVAGVITLSANKTYFITTTVDLTGDRILAGANTTIVGGSPDNSKLISTGLTGGGTPLITSSFSLPLRQLTIEANVGLNLNPGNISTLQNLSWYDVNFVNTPILGTISNYQDIHIYGSKFDNSSQLTIDGTVGDFLLTDSHFSGIAAQSSIIVPSVTVITDKFRVTNSFFTVPSTSVGLNVSSLATIPNESFILDRNTFTGSGIYTSGGLDNTSNRTVFTNNVGVTSSYIFGYLYVNNNATATTIATLNTWTLAAGTTTAGSSNNRFTHTNQRLTYTGTVSRLFRATVMANMTHATGNNRILSIAVVRNATTTTLPSEISYNSVTSGNYTPISTSDVFLLNPGDFIEVYVRNETIAVNITVQDMNLMITEIK